MEERRKLIRRRTPCPVAVFEPGSDTPLGWVANITEEGLMLKSEEALSTDHAYDLRIELPDPVNGQTEIRVQAHSLWSQKSLDPSFYLTGLELVNVPIDVSTIIKLLVNDAAFQRWIS